jgi:hypothetical protein
MAYGLHIFFQRASLFRDLRQYSRTKCPSAHPMTSHLQRIFLGRSIHSKHRRSPPVVEKMSLKSVLLADGEKVSLVAIRALGPFKLAKFLR